MYQHDQLTPAILFLKYFVFISSYILFNLKFTERYEGRRYVIYGQSIYVPV